MGENFLDRLNPAQPDRPAQPQPAAPITPAAPGTATGYALAALAGEVANLQAVPIGSGRNDQLNRSAVKLYGLAAAGEIDERTVTETLGAADGGLDYPATARTLRSARDAVFGKLGARRVEHTTQVREVAPWEQTDDPLADGYVWPSGGQSSGTPNDSRHAHAADASTTSPTSSSGTPTIGSTRGSVTSSGASSETPPAADAYAALVKVEASRVRLNRDARRLVDHEDAARDFKPPPYLPTLTDELAEPDEPVTYRVADLVPTGANVLLTAQYKTGKTTLVNNLARSLVDGVPFLGRYDVTGLDGRVALFNYEVDGRQYRRWLRDVGIVNTDAVAVLNLRGYRLPLLVPHVEQWVVDWLAAADARVWIVDPFARAFVGSGDENSNTEVGPWLDTLDVIKRRAGVSELVLPAHTGRAEHEPGSERARGATRLNDWADVEMVLTKARSGARFLRAEGRDVLEAEQELAFDGTTRHITATGKSRREASDETIRAAILATLADHPGVNRDGLIENVGERAGTRDKNRIGATLRDLIDRDEVLETTEQTGGRGRPAKRYYLAFG
ncbi:MAG TPA: AAA family ATPase [Jatrophihabitans sp.]|nr:AAA family ATPase [Jatrophihabitans sp.]